MVGFVLASLQQETPDFIGSGWIGERQSGSGNNANKEHPDCHSPIEAIHHQHRNEESGSYQRDGSDMKELIHQYGAWIVFGLVFLESIGLPLPGEATLVSAAVFAGTTQELGIGLVLLSAVSGAILGSTISFWIGDRYGYPLLQRYGSYIGLTETRIKIAQYLFRRRGMAIVLIARFVAVLRSVVGFIAGANRMPFANFMIASCVGAVAWALFYGLGAYYLGRGVERFARPFAFALAAVGVIVALSLIRYWRRKEQELAAAAERDIPGPLQAERSID
jgi:membrane protein DedA with SNARE-associated domain